MRSVRADPVVLEQLFGVPVVRGDEADAAELMDGVDQSAETCVVVIDGVSTTATSFRRSRKVFARSVIWSKSATQRLYSHFSSWRARNGFSPIAVTNASSSARVSPSRFVFAGRSGVAFIAATILQS